LVVFSTSLFSSGQAVDKDFFVDPFRLKGERQLTKINEIQIAASVAEVIGGNIKEEANAILGKQLTVALPISADENFLAKPMLASTTIPAGRKTNTITEYVVQNGDTLWTIAEQFDITTDTVLWANDLEDENLVKPGQKLIILPVAGVLHTVKSGETFESIANKYSASANMIISFNDLEDTPNLKEGMKLIVPDGTIPEPPKPVQVQTQNNNDDYDSAPRTRIVPSYGGPNQFPYGYCTWWVASKRYVPWNGNAADWYWNARAMGYATGRTPVPGSIMVTWESPIGHVAYVESVNGNSFTISEMNVRGWGIASSRTITPGQVPLIGFIY